MYVLRTSATLFAITLITTRSFSPFLEEYDEKFRSTFTKLLVLRYFLLNRYNQDKCKFRYILNNKNEKMKVHGSYT